MADITIYKPAEISVEVIEGVPPADQTALVAELEAKIAAASLALTDAAAAVAAAQAALA